MKYTITINLDTSQTIYEQIKRNGFAVVKDGNLYAVRVPNRILSRSHYNIEVVEDHPEDHHKEHHNEEISHARTRRENQSR